MLPALHYQSLLLQCRPGFENDLSAEICQLADRLSAPGYCRSKPDTGYIVFHGGDEQGLSQLLEQLSFRQLIFARQSGACLEFLPQLPAGERTAPIVAALRGIGKLSDIWLEYPDTNEGKQLSTFCRRFRGPLLRAIGQAGIRVRANTAAPRLQLFFLDSGQCFVTLAAADNGSPWPLGIPRLKMPAQAPSRSTLKLDEAIGVFLSADEQQRRLAAGMRAVDLGAAPGGWSWQLTRRGLRVHAIDNGPIAPQVMATGLVEHLRADGFRYRPQRPVDWLVCDMVEQPGRIAALMADWLARRDCREAIFNLKLPMKKRFASVQECLALIARRLERAGIGHELACKQLYHDREEVTVHVRLLP